MQQSGVSFGTSGARGLVAQMTDRVCYLYTCAFIQFLRQQNSWSQATVFIAGDLRPSTPRIIAACIKAIEDNNIQAVYIGRLATPALTAYAMARQAASIMVTGSHIPDDRNGIKFNTPKGEILKPDEQIIRAQQVKHDESLFDQQGNFITPPVFTDQVDISARKFYQQRYLDFFPEQALAGLRIGVYQHSSVARDDMVAVLSALGADITELGRSAQFIPVDTEAIREVDQTLARQWATEYRFDAIVSTDGDGDRPLLSDEQGNWLRGDIVGILCARYLGIKHLCTPVSANSAVEKCAWFESVNRTRIGSPYVIAAMQALLAQGKQNIGGYEANGGFLLADNIQKEDQRLTALPTRDAMIVIVSVLHFARQQQKSLSQLVQLLPPRFTFSNRIKNFATQKSQQLIQAYSDPEHGQARLATDFPQLFMRDNTIVHIDHTDGLRIQFKNLQIMHLRPSGNAPELRCYTEADSVSQARKLNDYCLKQLTKRYLNA